MVRDILHHVSLLVIESPDKKEILIGKYDDTYPLEVFRNRVNLIGGNQHPEDSSPHELLKREIIEEFSIRKKAEGKIEESISRTSGKGMGAPLPSKYASEEDIIKIKNEILKFKPYGDFIVNVPYIKKFPLETVAIYSLFYITLPKDLFECARINLSEGRSIKSEGFAAIVSIEDLKNGEPLSAGATPLVLSHYLKTQIPDPYGLKGDFIGMPRAKLSDYDKDYKTTNVIRKQ